MWEVSSLQRPAGGKKTFTEILPGAGRSALGISEEQERGQSDCSKRTEWGGMEDKVERPDGVGSSTESQEGAEQRTNDLVLFC